ncbi:universal stress protein [Streptomyces sp. NBC_00322]|uniref:universal stress protein n=1 Tax=Streptomyces sp. NBC_00322 TaxID=2975712 RepID=UPI002E2A6C14|nr:universal stress protein [Streptomyces sp. NBC_00322]
MELPLVVGVDGSESSLKAVDWAVEDAARHGLALRLVYASLWERYEGQTPAYSLGRPTDEVLADSIVATAAERAHRRDPDVKVTTAVLPEEAATALLTEGHNAFAVVTGSRGRGELAGLLLGSVSLAVAAGASCPVIVVRGEAAAQSAGHGRILLGIGEAARGSGAVDFAFREAAARGCTLDAVRAWRCPAHETTDHSLLIGDAAAYHEMRAATVVDEALGGAVDDHPDVLVRRTTLEGQARKVLLDRSAAADLLIVGARRRQGYFGLQLGRLAHAALHHAACPVAVVPQRV